MMFLFRLLEEVGILYHLQKPNSNWSFWKSCCLYAQPSNSPNAFCSTNLVTCNLQSRLHSSMQKLLIKRMSLPCEGWTFTKMNVSDIF